MDCCEENGWPKTHGMLWRTCCRPPPGADEHEIVPQGIQTLKQALLALLALLALDRHDGSDEDSTVSPGPLDFAEDGVRSEFEDVIQAFLVGEQHDPDFDRVYSPERQSYGFRGGQEYFKPAGWSYYAIRVEDFERIKDWPVAYHGTSNKHAPSILAHGLRPPGEAGVRMKHGSSGSRGRPTLYLSKSICVAAHPVYSRFCLLEPGRYAQIVFKCRVRPNSFRTQRNTLGRKHWDPLLQMDPDHADNDGLEWLVSRHEDVQLTGLMVREFGPLADASRYGPLVRHVVEPFRRGPEYVWIRLLQHERRRRGHYVRRHAWQCLSC